jgi:hypothetical protein
MNRRGVCYDVGRVMMGQDWRPVFLPSQVRRELEIIKNDLHCNAVRICGQNVDRLMTAGEYALDQGLEVWLSPELWDKSPEETLEYVVSVAERAEGLRKHGGGDVIFSVGSELTLFMGESSRAIRSLNECRTPLSGRPSSRVRTIRRSTPF